MTPPVRLTPQDVDPLEQLKALQKGATPAAPSEDDPLEQLKALTPKPRLPSSFSAQSTAVAPGQSARRAEQAHRPLLEGIDLPFGLQKDLNAAAQGATFGGSDEAAAGIRTLLGSKYADAIADERNGLAQFRKEHGTRAFLDELAGGMASTGGVNVFSPAKTVAGRVAQAAATGAMAGGATGAGSAEGGFQNRAKSAVKGAAMGAAVGGAVGGTVGEVGRRLAGRGAETVDQVADRKLVGALAKDELTPDQTASAATEFSDDKPAIVLDLGGRNTMRLGRAVRTQPSKGSAQLEQTLNTRAAGTEERTINDLLTTTGLGQRENPFQKADDLIATQKANAKPLYDKAYAAPPIDNPEVLKAIDSPDFREAFARGRRIAEKEGHTLPSVFETVQEPGKLVGPDGQPIMQSVEKRTAVPDTRSFDYMKRGLDDVIESKMSSGAMGRNEARVLRTQLRGVLAKVDDANPDYKAARAQFAGDAQAQEAYDLGRQLYTKHPDELALELPKMSVSEQELFRKGALEATGDRIESRATGRDPGTLANRTLDRKRLRLLYPDDAGYAAMQKRLGEEVTMHRTRVANQGGSQTVDKLAELADLADVPIDVAMKAATGNVSGALHSMATSRLAREFQARSQGITSARADALAARMQAGAMSRADLIAMLERAKSSVAAGDATAARRASTVTRGTQRVGLGAGEAGALRTPAPTLAIPSSSAQRDQRDQPDRANPAATQFLARLGLLQETP